MEIAVTFVELEVITFAPQCLCAMLFKQSEEAKVAKPNKKKVASKSTRVLRSGLKCKQLGQSKSPPLSDPAMTTLRDRAGEVASQEAVQSTVSQQRMSFQENKGPAMLEQTVDNCFLNSKLSLTINDVSVQTDEPRVAHGSLSAQLFSGPNQFDVFSGWGKSSPSLVSDSHLETELAKDRRDEQVRLQPPWDHSNSKDDELLRLNLNIGQEDVSLRSPFLHRISPFLEFCTVTNKEKLSEAWWQADDVGIGCKRECDVAAVNGTEFKEGGCSTDGDESRDGAKVVTGDIPANEYENVSVCPFVEKTQRFTDNNEPGAWCEDCDGLHMAKEVGHSREMNETLVETEIATKAADVAVSGTESETVALLVNVTTDKTLVNKTMDSTGAEDEMNVRNVQQEAALSQPCKLRLRIRPAPANSHLCLTPLGLPKAKRLKKNFTLEDVYLNRNYKTPPQNRKYETIFENPQEQKGRLVLTSRAKKCRSLIFGTKRGHRKSRISRSSWTNICRSSTEEPTLDSLLLHKLAELEMPVAPDE
uniref:Tantalus-like domain-containing protein n=2 Tax=Eptatretus burgeri TaxID=7764 RepID=A0A8C4QXZ4_EPTBU